MSTIPELQKALADAKQALADAQKAAQEVIATAQQRVDDAQKALDNALVKQMRLGCWPCGPDVSAFDALEKKLGLQFKGYRPRGNSGQFEGTIVAGKAHVTGVQPLLKNHTDLKSRPGFVYSTNLNYRVGSYADKVPVPYGDIAAGKYDTALLAEFKKVAAYGGLVQCEHQSELNVGDTPPAAQPAVPDPQNFEAAFLHCVALSEQAGATNLLWVISFASTSSNIWGKGKIADKTFTPKVLEKVFAIGQDAYNRSGLKKTPNEMFDIAYNFAKARNKPYTICETGCAEQGDGGTFKATWYAQFNAWLLAHDVFSCYLNHGDQPSGPYTLDTTSKAFDAAKRLVATWQ